MKYLWWLLPLALVGCGENVSAADSGQPFMGTVKGTVPANGGGTYDVRVVEVDGTKCVLLTRYSAVAISCNWRQ